MPCYGVQKMIINIEKMIIIIEKRANDYNGISKI